jgi:hypothetical protein
MNVHPTAARHKLGAPRTNPMKVPLLLACLFPALGFAQGPSGTYLGTNWQINDHHTLLWAGQPYMPVGQKIDGNAAEVDKANAAGTKDLLVDVPASGAGWNDAFAALNKNQDRFLLRINSLAPMATGIAVEPQGYRVANITGAKHIEFSLPDATSALVLMVNQTDASVAKSTRVPIVNGKFSYDAPSINGMSHVMLVYPEMISLEQPDFWEGFDQQRDAILNALRQNAPGAGLRGIVDPIGRIMSIPGHNSRFVPTSDSFRDEFAALLTARYHSVETASRAWSISAPDFKDMSELSRLVPLWSGYRGISQLWDPANDHLFLVDNKHSAVWKDINDAILLAATRRFKAIVSAVRQVTDVPVIQEWAGWAPPYDGSQISIDGVGVRVTGNNPIAQIDSSCRAVSSLLRWNRPGWLIATDVDFGGDKPEISLAQSVSQLSDMGVRGYFTSTPPTQHTMDASMAEISPSVLYFPQNATNPPMAQRLPGGMWWLPSPADGDRIDLGSKFAAYRLKDGDNNFTAIWSPTGPQRTVLRFADFKSPTFSTIDGSDPKPKLLKDGVEITISDVPLIIKNTQEIPVPDPTADETANQFTSLLKALGYDRGAVSEEQYYFSDAARGFARSPGDSLTAMRIVLRSSLLKVAPYVWIEAENCKDHNFSQISNDAGCSDGHALELDTKITPDEGFSATYKIPVRSRGDQELWIAARIPEEFRDNVTVVLAGATYTIPQQGASTYGDGYTWYRIATTKLGGNESTLKILVNAPHGADLGIDAIVIYPGVFHPNGVQMPLVPEVKLEKGTEPDYMPSPHPPLKP